MNLAGCLAAVSIALAGCGDNAAKTPVSDGGGDASNPDAPDGIPLPPALGPQIDRVGRAAITTLLVDPFATSAAMTADRDTYSRASDPATWSTTALASATIEVEFARNLARFDGIDLGMQLPAPRHTPGCGTALGFGGVVNSLTYQPAARLLADDQLYVDTAMPTCGVYLDLEIEKVDDTFLHGTCGGRTLTADAIDMTYSLLIAGLDGLDGFSSAAFSPRLHDGVARHTDVLATFPFLGPPH